MNINVHIERLVLDGVFLSPDDRPVLQATIESELTRLIEQQGWQAPSGSTHVYRVTGDPMQLGGTVDAASLGQQIARSVHGGNA